MDEALIKQCFLTALHGEKERGSDGVIYCDLTCKDVVWLKIDEVTPSDLREAVRDLLTEDTQNYFVLVKQDMNIDVVRVEKNRARALESVVE